MTHAVPSPITRAVAVTATVNAIVLANSSTSRSIGIASVMPRPITRMARLIGGISPGNKAIPAASHHPRLGRCLTGPGSTLGRTRGAVNSHQPGLGHEAGGEVEDAGELR